MTQNFSGDFILACYSRSHAGLLVGDADIPSTFGHIGIRILAALWSSSPPDSRGKTRRGLLPSPGGAASLGFFLGGDVTGESDPRAAAAGTRSRVRVLGILRLCA